MSVFLYDTSTDASVVYDTGSFGYESELCRTFDIQILGDDGGGNGDDFQIIIGWFCSLGTLSS